MLQTIKKGFTLIELLVVITIIGILATGATTVYTSQIQKARDTTRINDIKALQSGVEQVYQDGGRYPLATTFTTQVTVYVPRLPSDPKHAQPCNNKGAVTPTVDCGYAYIVWSDNNGISYGEYELSTAFENEGNVDNRAVWDNGNDSLRLEVGLDVGANTTTLAAWAIPGTAATNPGACAQDNGNVANTDTELIFIHGNPTTVGAQCD